MRLSDRFRRYLEEGERSLFRLLAMGVFALVVLTLLVIAVAGNSMLLGVASAVVLGVILRAFLPERRMQRTARAYATGRAGDRWRRRWEAFCDRLGGFAPW